MLHDAPRTGVALQNGVISIRKKENKDVRTR